MNNRGNVSWSSLDEAPQVVRGCLLLEDYEPVSTA
jgi:hypothetical protein